MKKIAKFNEMQDKIVAQIKIEKIKAKTLDTRTISKWLYNAFYYDLPEIIKLIINNYPELVNRTFREKSTLYMALHIKDISSRHEIMQLLLDRGFDKEIMEEYGYYLLDETIEKRQAETFIFLKSKGAKLYGIGSEIEQFFNIFDAKDSESIFNSIKDMCTYNIPDVIEFGYYEQIQEVINFYCCVSEDEKYNNDQCKNKISEIISKAKKDAIQYMLILQDQLMHYAQDRNNPQSMLIKKYTKLAEEKQNLTNTEIKKLQNSIINLLQVKKGEAYHVAMLMNCDTDETNELKKCIESEKKYILPTRLQKVINDVIEKCSDYGENPITIYALESLKNTAEIAKLREDVVKLQKKLDEQSHQIIQNQSIIKLLCDCLQNSEKSSLKHNSPDEYVRVDKTGDIGDTAYQDYFIS